MQCETVEEFKRNFAAFPKSSSAQHLFKLADFFCFSVIILFNKVHSIQSSCDFMLSGMVCENVAKSASYRVSNLARFFFRSFSSFCFSASFAFATSLMASIKSGSSISSMSVFTSSGILMVISVIITLLSCKFLLMEIYLNMTKRYQKSKNFLYPLLPPIINHRTLVYSPRITRIKRVHEFHEFHEFHEQKRSTNYTNKKGPRISRISRTKYLMFVSFRVFSVTLFSIHAHS